MSINIPSRDSIIGGSISTSVASQIQARKKILSNPSLGNDYLNFSNGNTGWVRISSSVDTLSIDKKPSSGTARQNVLLGGTLSNGRKRQGIFSTNSSYDSSTLGTRPMAGITGFTVENRSFAGALRTGTFELTLTTLEQLSTLEQLYMRPGFTVFIEYGHSIFVQNNGSISSNATYLKNYFELTSREEVIEQATFIRDSVTDYNYDFMYAYITNFNWQSTELGVYDVSVTFVTSGDLIDSISTAISGGGKISNDNDSSITVKERTTALHTLLYYINHSDTEKYFDTEELDQDEDKDARISAIEEALVKYCSPIWGEIDTSFKNKGRKFSVIRTQIGDTPQQGSWFRYISLGFLLECLNYIFIPITDSNERIFNFNVERYSPFTTFKEHFCIDPAVAVLPKKRFSTADTNFKFLFAEQESFTEEESDLLNIHLNIDFVLGLLDNLLDSEEFTDQSLYTFVYSILKRLSNDLGGINDFDLHLDDTTEEFFVVDRTVLPTPEQLKDTRYKLDVFGKGTTVESFSLGSTIPSSMSAIVAASAGAKSSDLRNKLHSMFRWNEGLIDRTVGTLKNDEILEDQLSSLRTEMIGLARYLKNLNVSAFYLNYSETNLKGVRQVHKKIMSILLEYYTNSPEDPSKRLNSSGLIPITVKLALKGISGLKVGQAFTIQDEILPERYREKVAFQIVHLSNTINDNRWVTELDGMMFMLNVPEDNSNEVYKLPEITVADLEREFENIPDPPVVIPPEIQLAKPLPELKERNDSEGYGYYGAPRIDRVHTGWDVLAEPGTIVKSPIDGQPYKNLGFGAHNHPMIGILGTGEYNGWLVILGYCDWPDSVNYIGQVKKGETVGKVTDLTKPYNSGGAYPEDMKNHVHIKVTYFGELVDPSTLNFV